MSNIEGRLDNTSLAVVGDEQVLNHCIVMSSASCGLVSVKIWTLVFKQLFGSRL